MDVSCRDGPFFTTQRWLFLWWNTASLGNIAYAVTTPWQGGATITTDWIPTVYQTLEELFFSSKWKENFRWFLKWSKSLSQHWTGVWPLKGTWYSLNYVSLSPLFPLVSLDSGPPWLVPVPPCCPSILVLYFLIQWCWTATGPGYTQSPPGLSSFCSLLNALPFSCSLLFTLTSLTPTQSRPPETYLKHFRPSWCRFYTIPIIFTTIS